jgi:hypothetical protein
MIKKSQIDITKKELSYLPEDFTCSRGSCMAASELITKKLLQRNIKDFYIVEGWLDIVGVEGETPHTWIELSNGEKLDPSLKQFEIWGLTRNDLTYSRIKKKYTPEEYLSKCEECPVDISKYINKKAEYIGWYKKAQETLSLDDLNVPSDDYYEDDKEHNRAVKYFNVGHGDFVEEFGYAPNFQVWILLNGKILKSKIFKADPEKGDAIEQTHGSLWGTAQDYSYKGRYEPQTGRLTIVKPEMNRFREIPNEVLAKIREAFPKVTKMIVAKNNNWYKKAEIRYGEWWIIDSQAVYADGDIGDMSHSRYVIESILANYDIDVDNPKFNINKISNKQLMEQGMPEEEINVVREITDARDYGMEHLGWKRVKNNNVETYVLDNGDLRDIANGLWDAYDEDANNETFNIEVISTSTIYENIPYSVIEKNDVTLLNEYRYKYDNT